MDRSAPLVTKSIAPAPVALTAAAPAPVIRAALPFASQQAAYGHAISSYNSYPTNYATSYPTTYASGIHHNLY